MANGDECNSNGECQSGYCDFSYGIGVGICSQPPVSTCHSSSQSQCSSLSYCVVFRSGDYCYATSEYGTYSCSDIEQQSECSKISSVCEWIPSLNRCQQKSLGYCGNNKIDSGLSEVCDGTDLAGKTCLSWSTYTGGTLKCVPQCSSYDISSCTLNCNAISNPSSCSAYPQCIYYSGDGMCTDKSYISAASDCQYLNQQDCPKVSLCEFNPNSNSCQAKGIGYCGNNKIDGNEQCDLVAFNSKTCITEGFSGGELRCKSDCTLDTSFCITKQKLSGYLSIATTKDIYGLGEKIELTDPPETSVIGNIITNLDNNIITNKKVNNYNYSGYIIEFQDAPLVVKKNELENRDASRGRIARALQDIGILNNAEEDYANYQNEINRNHESIKNEIFTKINSVSAAKPTRGQQNGQNTILREFEIAFNGIALNISDAEAMQLKEIDGVKEVYPNYEVHTDLMDSVPLVGADKVWQMDADGNNCKETGNDCLTGKGIKIAIVDTGVDYTHPDLGGCDPQEFATGYCTKVVGGYDFINNDNDPMDDKGHGTHVASIAAGNGDWNKDGIVEQGEGLNGIAPDASIYAYKVLDSSGSGKMEGVIAGIERAVEDNVSIISMSLGGYGNPDDPVSQASDNAVKSGIVVVVAAGNSGPASGTIGSPGTARKAITVGASYKKDYNGIYWKDENPKKDQITSFSSRGPVVWYDQNNDIKSLIKPDIVAPGALICAARYDNIFAEGEHQYYKPCHDNKHVQLAGTSMATPIVSGSIALLKQKHLDWNPEEIKMALRNSAVDLSYDVNEQGYGRIDVLNLIKQSKSLIAELYSVDYSNGEITIKGTADGDNFNKYEIYYKKNNSEESMNLICQGNELVKEDILCKREINLNEGDDIELNLIVYGINGEKSEDRTYYYINLDKNWPIIIDDVIFSSANFGDLDGDGKYEIVATAKLMTDNEFLHESAIYIWRDNGEGFTNKDGLFIRGLKKTMVVPPTIGDLDKDGSDEIILDSEEGLYMWDISNPENNWVRRGVNFDIPPIIININEDDYKEIVRFDTNENKVVIFNKKGEELYSWPILQNSSSYFILSLSVADLDSDGEIEIIASIKTRPNNEYGGIYVFNKDGLYKWHKKRLSDIFVLEQHILGDVDGDNKIEIIRATPDKLQILNSNGNIISEWYEKDQILTNTILLGDLDGDKNLEIVYSDIYNNIYARYYDGKRVIGGSVSTTGLISLPKNGGLPIIADINNDGRSDIISSNTIYHSLNSPRDIMNNLVYAWNWEGILLKDFPKKLVPGPFGEFICSPSQPTIVDINKDDNLDLIIQLCGGMMYVFNLGTTSRDVKIDWPMFMHDPQHTNCANCDKIKIMQNLPTLPTIKSMINNTGDVEIRGYLQIYISKFDANANIWKKVKTIIDDLKDNNERVIPKNEYLALDKIANIKMTPLIRTGKYKVYAALLDNSGNVISTESGILESSYEFSVVDSELI